MKKNCFLSLVAVGFASIVSVVMAAETKLSSVQNSPSLVSYLQDLSAIAAVGASVEFFGWSESFEKPDAVCKVVNAEVVVRQFREIAKEIVDGVKKVDQKAMNDFATLVGRGDYEFCYNVSCSDMSCERVYSFMSLNTPYKIQFQVGYED